MRSNYPETTPNRVRILIGEGMRGYRTYVQPTETTIIQMNSRYNYLFSVLMLMGCSSSDITSSNDVVFPAENISFAQKVEPLFAVSCNSSGCHDAARSSNNFVDLTSWYGTRATNVVNQPGDTTCGLLQVVFGREFHPGINLNSNHRQGLKQWVLEGAQNN
ncbi:MAG: hypothetical protein WCH46_04970 [bacterium]